MNKRHLIQTFLAASALSFGLGTAHAQTTPIKFQLDWRFEGPGAFFTHPAAKGYFKASGLDVTQGNNDIGPFVNSDGNTYHVPGFNAGPGYDLASGLGTIDAARFVPALARAANLGAR